jgi:hypothetical protein
MNLHGIASAAISAVNPMIPVSIRQSTGYTTGPDGTQAPNYSTVNAMGQQQALSGGDIQRLNSLNVQGVVTKMYLTGNFEGAFRVTGKGGDLVGFGGRTYLVATVLERWDSWCCIALVMQT